MADNVSWDYPKKVEGSSFKVELSFHELRVWLTGEEKPRVIKTEELQGARSEPDGSTKLDLHLRRDLTIPSSAAESLKLVDALNALLNERRATEVRDKEAGQARWKEVQRSRR